MQNWDDDVLPAMAGHYRDDRRNVFQDGNSNLVLCATQEGPEYFSGKVLSNWRGQINTTWEARIKLDCMFPGLWPAYWLLNQDPLPDGEVDVMEFYGNMKWAPGTTVHAASNGKPGKASRSRSWSTRRGTTGESIGARTVSSSGGTTSTAPEPYFTVPPTPIPVHGNTEDKRWPFSIPGYWLQAIFNLGVGGSGGGDPTQAPYPSVMLIDWIRVW